jgi:hypothetical protein
VFGKRRGERRVDGLLFCAGHTIGLAGSHGPVANPTCAGAVMNSPMAYAQE